MRYVFSDKTGTLTRNVMAFRRCSVAGQVFGNLGDDEEEEEAPAPVVGVHDHDHDRIRAEEGSGTSRGGSEASKGSSRAPAAAAPHPYAVEGLPLRCDYIHIYYILGIFSRKRKKKNEPTDQQSTNTHSELSRRSAPSSSTSSSSAAAATAQLAYRHFAEVLAVCHTVVVETDAGDDAARTGTGTRTYQVCDVTHVESTNTAP